MNKIIISAFVLICVVSSITGCAGVPTRRVNESGDVVRVEKPLAVSSTLRFEDAPVPAGFNIIRDQSFVYQDSSIRLGLLRYAGRAKASQVISFFRAQMPLYNWNIINMVEFGTLTMNFTKADENCVIVIEPLTTKTLVDIIISPRSGSVSTDFGSGSRKERF
jgi:hypothetical protein